MMSGIGIKDQPYKSHLVELQKRIEELEKKIDATTTEYLAIVAGRDKRIEKLKTYLMSEQKYATQRGARMQMLWRWIDANNLRESFLLHIPEAADWFDEHGVPVRKAREKDD